MANSDLIEQLSAAAAAGPSGLDESQRFELMAACTKLNEALQSPFEKIVSLCWSGFDCTALRLAIDIGLPDVVLASGGPILLNELAEKSNADPILIRRILRLLCINGIFSEVDVDTYGPTPSTPLYSTGSPLRDVVLHLSSVASTAGKLPDYFAEKGYQNPSNTMDSPWQYAEGTKEHYWVWLAKHERLQRAFNTVMGLQRTAFRGEPWFDFFPAEEKLLAGTDENRVVLVDIGGGLGHDLVRLKTKFPDMKGKLILEDLPIVVADAKDLPTNTLAIGHDFFNPQPEEVHGAKAYFLNTVLHDWPDSSARTILGNIKAAMAEDSVLLVNEGVLPDKGVSSFDARCDFEMMSRFAAMERTEGQWVSLFESAGFEVVKFWRAKNAAEAQRGGLIELVVKK